MYDGQIRKVEELQVGDRLMGPDSNPRTILALCQGRERMVRIIPRKGDSWVVNESHILSLVKTTRSRKVNCPSYSGGKIIDVTVREWMTWPKSRKHLYKLFRTGVNFPKQPERLRLNPYLLGLWLGDGRPSGSAKGGPTVLALLAVLQGQ
jgi:hypothetical protein